MGTILKIKWSVKESGKEVIDLSDLAITEEAWNELTIEEKDKYVTELLEETDLELIPEVVSWSETND